MKTVFDSPKLTGKFIYLKNGDVLTKRTDGTGCDNCYLLGLSMDQKIDLGISCCRTPCTSLDSDNPYNYVKVQP